ncbi:MAG: putative lipoprotein [Labilithrix sp.]|nr:putative lipoprotein [Labilithrix sp.]
MLRLLSLALVATGLGLLAASCAQGDDPAAPTEVSDAAAACVPSGIETCNGKDDNCDGRIDEGFDSDGDGVPSCAVGSTPADCDDHDALVHPGAAETCNGKDDTCDGVVDEGFDEDNDGFYACAHAGAGDAETIPVDCDDTVPQIHPGAAETCNGKDDDCNGKVDDRPASITGNLTAPPDAHWRTAGTALIANAGAPVQGWAQLTQANGGVGALWWDAAYTFDVFDMSATFWIESKADGADGMAFVWMDGRVPTALGYGSYYGAGSLPGYAVAIDTFQNPGDPPVPYLLVLDAGPVTPLGKYPIPNVRDAHNHLLRVTLDTGNKVSVWIDNVSYVSGLALPSAKPRVGQWGFTGGTGGSAEAHWVTDITMKFPGGQGCVP